MTNTASSPISSAPRRFVLLPEASHPAAGERVRIRRYRLATVGTRRAPDFGPPAREPQDFAHLQRSYD
ncbi:MAG TPA: hypothetical protein VHX88_06045 [Solirubrobacteraceae bacterium]|nr:hypothetical protein [Solirubrobacteraceae bacterium]